MKNKTYIILLFISMVLSSFSQNQNLFLRAYVSLQYHQFDSVQYYLSNIESLSESDSIRKAFIYGQSYFYSEKYSEAIPYLQIAHSVNDAELLIAKAYARLGMPKLTIEFITKYLQREDKCPKSQILLDKDFEFLASFSEWKEIWKNNPYSNLQITLSSIDYKIMLDKEMEALDTLNNLLNVHKRNSEIFYSRAKVWLKMNAPERAIEDLKTALTINKNNKYRLLLADTYFKNEDFKEAKKNYFSLLDDSTMQYHLAYAKACIADNDLQNALKTLNQYTKYFYNSHESFYYLAMVHQLENKKLDAVLSINKAIALNRTEAFYFIKRAELYLAMESYDLAERDVTSALDLKPDKDFYYLRGEIREQMGKVKEACNDYQRAYNIGRLEAQYKVNELCK